MTTPIEHRHITPDEGRRIAQQLVLLDEWSVQSVFIVCLECRNKIFGALKEIETQLNETGDTEKLQRLKKVNELFSEILGQ